LDAFAQVILKIVQNANIVTALDLPLISFGSYMGNPTSFT